MWARSVHRASGIVRVTIKHCTFSLLSFTCLRISIVYSYLFREFRSPTSIYRLFVRLFVYFFSFFFSFSLPESDPSSLFRGDFIADRRGATFHRRLYNNTLF